MSPRPDPHVQLRPAPGAAVLERPLLELTGGPWGGRVVVRRYTFTGRTQPRWSIEATWHGPPMPIGFPPNPPVADRSDQLLVRDDELELARAVAQAAIDDLRAARVPDLRALRKRFNRGR